MRIRHDNRDDVRVVHVKGCLAGVEAEEKLWRVLNRIIRWRTTLLIVDLTEVTFVSVMVVSVFVKAHYDFRDRGGRVVFSGANERVAGMITMMTNLEYPLELVATHEEAKTLLAPPEPVPIVEA